MSRMLQFAWAALVPSRPEPTRTFLEPATARMRVLPQDLDFMMVVNNGSYQQIMDVAGYRQMGKNGGLRLATKQSWVGVVAASTIRYRRSLRLWDQFEDTSRVLGWDDRVFYIEHRITRHGELYTRGVICLRFLHRRTRERISPHEIVRLLAQQQGHTVPQSPELPADIAEWAATLNHDVTEKEPVGG
ncbi:acyl-CoA thioesterase [Promicromonospora xylanilytica]